MYFTFIIISIADFPNMNIVSFTVLSTAGLVQTLRNTNASYTMFAPTDSAFMSAAGHPIEKSHNRCTVSMCFIACMH